MAEAMDILARLDRIMAELAALRAEVAGSDVTKSVTKSGTGIPDDPVTKNVTESGTAIPDDLSEANLLDTQAYSCLIMTFALHPKMWYD